MNAKVLDDLKSLGVEYIQFPNLMGKDVSHELEIEIKQWLISPKSTFVLDFGSSIAVAQPVLTKLTQFRNSLVKAGKAVYSINIAPMILSELKQRGLEQSFGSCKNLEEVFSKLQPSGSADRQTQKVDAKVLLQFIESASEAFEVQMGVKIRPHKMKSKKYLYEDEDAIVGIVEVDSSGFKGSVTICFTEKVFLAIYKALLDEDLDRIDEDSKDAAGELINIIYGNAKAALNKNMGQTLKPALPKVQLKPKRIDTTQPVIVVPFSSEVGDFRIEIYIY